MQDERKHDLELRKHLAAAILRIEEKHSLTSMLITKRQRSILHQVLNQVNNGNGVK